MCKYCNLKNMIIKIPTIQKKKKKIVSGSYPHDLYCAKMTIDATL